ncbi:MAG: DsbA family protein [Candidatus Binatia bacterium]|nr:DsbA family protein [Candidatus Binatia bacterium]
MPDCEEVKVYIDYKSPYAYIAVEPAFALEEKYAVDLRWLPYQLRIKGKGERSQNSEWKARYSYMDVRRWANRRGGFMIRGPRKIYDTTPALIGGFYAIQEGYFRAYSEQAFKRFFEHRLELDVEDEIAVLIAEVGGSADGYRQFMTGDGPARLEAAAREAEEDHIFGVPIFVVRGEPFWGHDRIPLLEERLTEFGLATT